MAATTTPVSETRKIHPFRRTVGFLLIVVLLAILGVLGWFYSVARSALPQLDGTIRVPGLFAPVRVIRDIHGVPTIEAESLSDLYFTQGYVSHLSRGAFLFRRVRAWRHSLYRIAS